MCAVLHDKPLDNGERANLYKCGGSLIAPGVILTAAHCINDFKPYPEQLKVRCGEWDTQHQSEPYVHQDRFGKDIRIHPEFNPRNLANDFALIFLEQDFDLDFHIDTVCLPEPNREESNKKNTNGPCYATGWGKDRFGAEGEYQVVLKEVDLNIVESGQCQDLFRSTRLGQKFRLDKSFICAGGEGKDTCKGDGGGPLVCPSSYDPNTFEQVGIVAWGIGCGEEGVPGAYADVSEAVCWIDYATTCVYGEDFASYWSHTSSQCGSWFDKKLKYFDEKIAAGGRTAKIFEAMKSAYTECQVHWVDDTDLSTFQRDGYNNAESGDAAPKGGADDQTESADATQY